jgi:rare lipoprotein A
MQGINRRRLRNFAEVGDWLPIARTDALSSNKRYMIPLSRPSLVLAGIMMFGVLGCAEVNPGHHGVRQSSPTCTTMRAYHEVGTASWYGRTHHGRRTASGQIFNMNNFTAAHRSLPFGSKIKVTNIRNGRSVLLTVNDRGPFIRGRIVDVSYRAARELNFVRAGLAQVRIESSDLC